MNRKPLVVHLVYGTKQQRSANCTAGHTTSYDLRAVWLDTKVRGVVVEGRYAAKHVNKNAHHLTVPTWRTDQWVYCWDYEWCCCGCRAKLRCRCWCTWGLSSPAINAFEFMEQIFKMCTDKSTNCDSSKLAWRRPRAEYSSPLINSWCARFVRTIFIFCSMTTEVRLWRVKGVYLNAKSLFTLPRFVRDPGDS